MRRRDLRKKGMPESTMYLIIGVSLVSLGLVLYFTLTQERIDWVKRMQAQRVVDPNVKNLLTVVPMSDICVICDAGCFDLKEGTTNNTVTRSLMFIGRKCLVYCECVCACVSICVFDI